MWKRERERERLIEKERLREEMHDRGKENQIPDSYIWLVGWLVGWLVVLFFIVSTLFGSFNAELNFEQFSLEYV